MSVNPLSEEGQFIRQLIPLSTLPAEHFDVLCKKISVEKAKQNTFLFKRNETNSEFVYLIDGSIRLQSDNLSVETVDSDSESAKFALAHQIPRKIDAYTLSAVRYLRIDSHTLHAATHNSHKQEENNQMTINQSETDNNGDWMTALLKSPIFSALPPANLQQIVMSLKEVQFNKGELIIKQGEPGDYYYLIKKGQCLISRKPSANAKEIKLAKLHPHDTFGEDSLLSGELRNVSITALTDVSLIRLDKERFLSLIKEPSLNFISYKEIPEAIIQGAVLIDVRLPDEYKAYHLSESINVPFFSLRVHLKSIDKRKPVIVVCENGKASEAAAFLLLRNRIQTQILEGGMEGIPTENREKNALSEKNINKKPSPQLSDPLTIELPKDTLSTENIKLKQSLKLLQEEKEMLEKKYRLLFKQSEKLKAALSALKKED